MSDWFKVVLPSGAPAHGGDRSFRWSLPTKADDGAWTPGEWAEIDGPLELCAHGLHLTSEPARWWIEGVDVQLYRAEYDGEQVQDEGSDKCCVRKARLLEQVGWADHQVFSEGEHTISSGYVVARGRSHVEAWGSSHVEAWDSSHVEAWDSSHVVARDSSHVEAWDSSHVVARGSSHVEAWDSSHVVARGSSRVVARDSSHVEAWGSSHVEARDSSHVVAWGSSHVEARDSSHVDSSPYHSPSAVVALNQMAAHIDRRGGKTVMRCAGKELEVRP